MARGDKGYQRARDASDRAARAKEEAEEALRAKHEGKGHAPAKLTRAERRLVPEGDKKKRRFGR